MEALLDFSHPVDVKLLDAAVAAFNADGNKQVENILVTFQHHPLAWTQVDRILDQSQQASTRLLAISILTQTIASKWALLPQQQRDGIKTYIVSLIIKLSSTPQSLTQESLFIRKLDEVLIAVVKQEWPANWPNFIPELVESSKANQSLCANNMNILLLLSEEIFDYSHGHVTSEKMREMKKNLNKEFTLIFQLCDYILDHSNDQILLTMTLKTLQRFLHWIPVGYIFETRLIDTLSLKFFPVAAFQNETLQCLSEIGGLSLKPEEETKYKHKFISLFFAVISAVSKLITAETDVARIYDQGDPTAQAFIRYLTIFITSFLRAHLELVEQGSDDTRTALALALKTLLKLSTVEDIEVFKICLDYWNILVTDLYQSTRLQLHQRLQQQPFSLSNQLPPLPIRIQFYAEILHRLRLTLISRMGKPEEILIVEDDAGQIVQEVLKDSDSVVLYKSMREALIYLTHLDPTDTQNTMLDKLSAQVDGREWSWHNLNTLCWAIGSISGALQESQEKTFLVRVIKDLLHLVELKRGKEHKAVIASNIMYIVGQYPRFLKDHWKFLKTVVNKLFEFMHESHPGVQDMSVDTFVKIAKKCKRKFVQVQDNEKRPFIVEIVENLSQTIADLEGRQIQVFYEACAEIISAESDSEKSQQLIQRLMALPNQTWTAIITAANGDASTLWDSKTVKQLVMVLKTNSRVASALGHAYLPQLGRLYVDMLQVYKMYSSYVSMRVGKEGPVVTKHADIKGMRAVKKEILNLISMFVSHSSDGEREMIYSKFLPPLMDPVLDDYKTNVPDARETEVLNLFAELCKKLNDLLLPHIPRIFESLFSVTLEMITRNFQDYPEHRLAFFNLLHAIVRSCFPALLRFSAPQFQLVMDSILWAMKHLDRNIAEIGLETMLLFLTNISKSEVANHFYQTYFISILSDLLGLITDTFHKPGLRLQSLILQKLFSLVESGSISSPLWLNANNPIPGDYANNQSYVRQYVVTLLKKAFDHVTLQQIQQFTAGLFQLHQHEVEFKDHLRDFLITLKEFQADPSNEANRDKALTNTELFEDERIKAEELAKEEERKRLEQVPGLLYIPPQSHLAPRTSLD